MVSRHLARLAWRGHFGPSSGLPTAIRIRHVVLLALLAIMALPAGTSAQAPTTTPDSCAGYDAWEWAQLVFESDPQRFAALDADGNGEACPELIRGVGFAPAIWTDSIPAEAQRVELIRLIDGDTMEVLIDGVSNRVRILRADTPETQNEQHCGGPEATAFAEYALSFNDEPGVVYLERDENERDRYGRELAYVWFEVGGDPYMLNHILITSGWAEDIDYGDLLHDAELIQSAQFAETHQLGVYGLCGTFELPLTVSVPTQAPAVQQPAQPPAAVAPPPAATGCDPNYTPCVPISAADLDCGDIGFSVTVIGSDIHGFDGNGDGAGCE